MYILPLCFFLGSHIIFANYFACHWIRKDHLMICFFIAILWIYSRKNISAIIKLVIINFLAVLILLTHEMFAFFALPVLFVLFFSQYKNKGILKSAALSLLSLLPCIFAFCLTLIYKGDYQIAQAMWDSWVSVANQKSANVDASSHAALSAIGWETLPVFKFHFLTNFFKIDYNILSLVAWSVVFLSIYYIATNILFVFRKNEKDFTDKNKTVLSSVLIFQFMCLLPVFTVLCCDYGRVIFLWMASSFAVFILIPANMTEKIFPAGFFHLAERINNGLSNILRPTKTVLILLVMFTGVSDYDFFIQHVVSSTFIYNVLFALSKIAIILKGILIAIVNFI
ncbi:MAG: hypothetical protein LBH19_11435 [Dysgonamonadaceae bacterium]|nr:hypothetical protein [Dysgonamonadaceae bacterium]